MYRFYSGKPAANGEKRHPGQILGDGRAWRPSDFATSFSVRTHPKKQMGGWTGEWVRMGRRAGEQTSGQADAGQQKGRQRGKRTGGRMDGLADKRAFFLLEPWGTR